MTDPTSKSMLIKEIIEDALGNLADWKQPTAEKSIGLTSLSLQTSTAPTSKH